MKKTNKKNRKEKEEVLGDLSATVKKNQKNLQKDAIKSRPPLLI